MPDEITTGELSRQIKAMERMMDWRFTEVNRTIQGIEFVHKEVHASDIGTLQLRVSALEKSQIEQDDRNRRWLMLAIGSGLLPLMIGIILIAFQMQ